MIVFYYMLLATESTWNLVSRYFHQQINILSISIANGTDSRNHNNDSKKKKKIINQISNNNFSSLLENETLDHSETFNGFTFI